MAKKKPAGKPQPGDVTRPKYPERSTRKGAKGPEFEIDKLAKRKNITRAAAAQEIHNAKLSAEEATAEVRKLKNPIELEPRTDDTIADSAATETPKHDS